MSPSLLAPPGAAGVSGGSVLFCGGPLRGGGVTGGGGAAWAQGFSSRVQRDLLRSTWVPTGRALQRLEEEDGIVIRFIIGRSCAPPSPPPRPAPPGLPRLSVRGYG